MNNSTVRWDDNDLRYLPEGETILSLTRILKEQEDKIESLEILADEQYWDGYHDGKEDASDDE